MDVFGEAWVGHADRIAASWDETVGPDDAVLLAGDLSWARHLDEARGAFQRAIQILEDARGETVDTVGILQNVAALLQDEGKYAEAVEAYRKRLAIAERAYGPQNTRVADTLDMMGLALTRSGHPEEGEAAALRSLKIRDENGTGGHPAQAVAYRLLAKQYVETNRHDKARGMFERSRPLESLSSRVQLVFHDVRRIGDDLRVIMRIQ